MRRHILAFRNLVTRWGRKKNKGQTSKSSDLLSCLGGKVVWIRKELNYFIMWGLEIIYGLYQLLLSWCLVCTFLFPNSIAILLQWHNTMQSPKISWPRMTFPLGCRTGEMKANPWKGVCQEEKLPWNGHLHFSSLLVCFGLKECKKSLLQEFLHWLPVTSYHHRLSFILELYFDLYIF